MAIRTSPSMTTGTAGGRPDLVGEDDEAIDPDAVIIAEDSDDADDSDETDLDEADLDEADDDTHPDTVVASGHRGGAGYRRRQPGAPSRDDTVADPVSADDTSVDPVSADDTAAEPVPGAEPIPASTTAGSPKHAAADSAAVRPGMPVNGDVPEGSPMAGDAQQLHERWTTIQSAFVDDPHGSVTSAADMVTEVIATVVASAQERESGFAANGTATAWTPRICATPCGAIEPCWTSSLRCSGGRQTLRRPAGAAGEHSTPRRARPRRRAWRRA